MSNSKIILHNAIIDMKLALNNEYIMQLIVAELARRINHSKIIYPEHKLKFNHYFESINKIKFDCMYIKNLSNVHYLLINAAIYYLSDLNYYDYVLINYAFDYGLDVEDIIMLLLFDNIYDVEVFCHWKNLINDHFYNILTLKKLSALWKIQYNF